MARPARPVFERALVLQAAGAQPGSAAQRARRLARKVAIGAILDNDREPDAEVEQLLSQLAASVDPVAALATCPMIDTSALLRGVRLRRFEARGCRHLIGAQIDAEYAVEVEELSSRLAARYARILRA